MISTRAHSCDAVGSILATPTDKKEYIVYGIGLVWLNLPVKVRVRSMIVDVSTMTDDGPSPPGDAARGVVMNGSFCS